MDGTAAHRIADSRHSHRIAGGHGISRFNSRRERRRVEPAVRKRSWFHCRIDFSCTSNTARGNTDSHANRADDHSHAGADAGSDARTHTGTNTYLHTGGNAGSDACSYAGADACSYPRGYCFPDAAADGYLNT